MMGVMVDSILARVDPKSVYRSKERSGERLGARGVWGELTTAIASLSQSEQETSLVKQLVLQGPFALLPHTLFNATLRISILTRKIKHDLYQLHRHGHRLASGNLCVHGWGADCLPREPFSFPVFQPNMSYLLGYELLKRRDSVYTVRTIQKQPIKKQGRCHCPDYLWGTP
eukprot:1192681-Prorocentrum_minimum.AAC.4